MVDESVLANLEAKGIGPLEIAIMNVIWKRGEATSREVFEAMREIHPYGQSTILTVLRRLTSRGLLNSNKKNDLFHYSPALSREELGGVLIDRITNRLFQGNSMALIEYLTEKGRDPDGSRS
ncbi:MAG: BlaI/MecI/CopY family transcriptional regulator [Chloroflexota bacterium]|jgi:BlaI family penicillinase repressor